MREPPQRLLMIRLGSLGDVILTTPVARAARRAFPEAHIAVLTAHPWSAIYEANPHVDEVCTVDRSRLDRSPLAAVQAARLIRAGHFDVSIDLQRKPKTALLAWAGGIPRRIGGTWIDTDRVPACPSEHSSAEAMRALEPLGVHSDDLRPEVLVSDADHAAAEAILQRQGMAVAAKPTLGIFPGAGWRPKAWPVDRFAEIARRASTGNGADVIVVGAGKDRDLVEHLQRVTDCAAFIDLRLGTLAGVLRMCDCVIASDSGPMHLAVAVGTPTIALFGPTDASRFGPNYEPHVVLADTPWTSVDVAWAAVRDALLRRCPSSDVQ